MITLADPELQPIERVWCAVKNEIAEKPCVTMKELEERLRKNFAKLVTLKVLASSWRQTKEYEQRYSTMDPEVDADGEEPEGTALSDVDVLDDGEDDEPAEQFDGPQH